MKYDIAIVSLYANPLHVGHLDYLRHAKSLAERLIVIVNSDEQVRMKGAFPFMSHFERLEIINSLKMVDHAFISVDTDDSVCKSLQVIRQMHTEEKIVFCNGGDRQKDSSNNAEKSLCVQLGIHTEYGVGGTDKRQSSSILIQKVVDYEKTNGVADV